MSDIFNKVGDMPDYSAKKLFAITPSNTNTLPLVTKAIYVGTGGTIAVITTRSFGI